MGSMPRRLLAVQTLLAACSGAVCAGESYSPYAGDAHPARVYWGDTHLHTNMSVDANIAGDMRMGPDEAYRFAKGETVRAQNGMSVRLQRPLDFLVVADHAEYLGLTVGLQVDDPQLLADPVGKHWHALLKANTATRIESAADATGYTKEMMVESFLPQREVLRDEAFAASAWKQVAANADRHYSPGTFTAFAGYEWSSMPEIDNLHRVVIFRDGFDKTSQVRAFSAFDSQDPEQLWRYLEEYERMTGGAAIAIPHNSNASNGRMFELKDMQGRPLTRDYAERRARWEPLLEVTQIKGDSEAHPLLSPDDAFADYETWDRGNLLFSKPKEPWMLQHEYARSALKLGLQQYAALGVNPFKFGMIGSTDAHTGLAAVEENNFWGKVIASEPSAERWRKPFFKGEALEVRNSELAASGYAAVWATENTREAIFAAMKRRETYATTGPRMTVRFFGGWEFVPGDEHAPDPARRGYAGGVPMGGDLPAPATAGAAPGFLVAALKDPEGANLDRIQIVKGWHDADGELHEKVYDVALADGRGPGADAASIGSSVDVARASYSNSIGDAELAAVWRDPGFDPAQSAFYYARVIEIPTPRWTARDAEYFGVGMDREVTMITQERAYTSPIWYTPANERR